MSKKKKIFISPERRPLPHGKYAYGNTSEHEVCYKIAELTKQSLLKQGFEVFIAPREWSLQQRVTYANANGFDYYLCIHTNAGGGTGTECLYYNHPASIKANQLVYKRLTAFYPSKRGLKDYSHFYENNATTMVSCYPEIAFHDNQKDALFIVENKQLIAKALAAGVAAYFGVDEKPTEPGNTHPEERISIEAYKALQKEKGKLEAEKAAINRDLEHALQNLEEYQDELHKLRESKDNTEQIKELERKLETIAMIITQ